jgi:hypothetical protein
MVRLRLIAILLTLPVSLLSPHLPPPNFTQPIRLGWNDIGGPAGAEKLAEALKVNSTVTYIR